MPYIVVTDFKLGMDRRRERVAGAPGTLWTGKNVHITRGADIERRKKFVRTYSVPGTFGLFSLNSQLYVFGSANHAGDMPTDIQYQRLQSPSGGDMIAVLDVKAFLGKLYVAAEYADGHVYHFFDGVRVTDWDAIAADGASFNAVALLLAQKIEADENVTASAYGSTITLRAKVAGTPFSVQHEAVDGGTSEVVPVASIEITDGDAEAARIRIQGGTADPGVNVISSVKIKSTPLINAPIDWASSHEDTATALAAAINALTGTHGFTATASSSFVSIAIPAGRASELNGLLPRVVTGGDVDVDLDPFAGGSITAVTVDGTDLIDDPVDWVSPNNTTAENLKDAINALTGTHGYTATRSQRTVTITAPAGVGATLNGTAPEVTAEGEIETEQVAFHNGVTASVDDQTFTIENVQENVPAVAEVRASAGITITGGTTDPGVSTIASVKVNDVELLTLPIDWSGSNAATAIRLATAIMNGFGNHGYTAEANGATVTIKAAPGTGATPNGYDVRVTRTGAVTVTSDGRLEGGVTEVRAVAQVTTATLTGTFDIDDIFTLIIEGVTYKVSGKSSGMGRSLFVSQKRIWSPVGSVWRYSMLNRGDVWNPDRFPVVEDNDAGFINVASETEGNETLVVAARYQGLAAIFAQNSVTLFQLDVDPARNALSDYLENTGTIAPRSVVRYGNNDVFYLDITGIRSLRARDSSNAPFVSDIGNAIDPFVQEYVDSLPKERLRKAVAAIEPRDGRFWLAIGDYIFVLSFFPGAKISAWTYYTPTEFNGNEIQALVRSDKRLHVRSGNNIFTYGGLDGDTYPGDDEVEAEVALPFLAGKTAATIKKLIGFDLAATNVWECTVSFDPNQPGSTINLGRLSRITMADPNSVNMPGETSMVAPRFTCSRSGQAKIAMCAVHYEEEKAG